ncbi:MAG: MFS transporter [Anaerolineae bacterium]|nr:MFS transporter [Anaerolineae bacterium]
MNSYINLLRENRNYRFLWLGAVISQIGDWFNLIASALIIQQLTSASAAVSLLFLARFLPLFLFSPFAGVLADRFDRRTILVASNLLRAVTVLGFLLVREASLVWLFYLLTVLQFALSSVYTPARTAVLANIVKKEELVTANALDSFTWSTMLAVGSLLGGLATGLFGVAAAFVIDALTFVLAGWLTAKVILPPELLAARAAGSRGSWLDFLDGLRYLRSEPYILALSLIKAGGSLVWGAINVLEIDFAEKVFPLTDLARSLGSTDGSALTLGYIYALAGLGTGFGPLLLRRWLGDAPPRLRWAITGSFWVLAAGILGLAAAPTLGWFGLATLVRTVGSGTLWVFSAAILQMIVPDHVRGRVFAFEFAALTLTQSISIFWAGVAQDALGMSVRTVTASVGLLGLLVAFVWLIFQLRTHRRPLGELALERSAP